MHVTSRNNIVSKQQTEVKVIIATTMKQVIDKHGMTAKAFSEVSGISYGTSRHIKYGRKSPEQDVFAPWLDWGIQHGMTSDKLKEMK